MKIQKLTEAHRAKAYALLRNAFPKSASEAAFVQTLHENGKPLHEWVCLHTGKAIAYIAFSTAFHDRKLCGLHLGPMAVAPEFQRQGTGAELLRFALRQEVIKSQPLYVLGVPGFFLKFGFKPCSAPICPYTKNNANFLSLRNPENAEFTIAYEAEFKAAAKAPKTPNPPLSTKSQGKNRR